MFIRFFNKIIDLILVKTKSHNEETLSEKIIKKEKLISRSEAIQNIHLPKNEEMIRQSKKRLKFEELFFLQLQILQLKNKRLSAFPGYVFKIQHEALLQDQEGITRDLLEFCELDFESSTLEFYKTERAVKTASSEQVRQPINTKGLNQWKNFESHLNDLKHYLAPIEN